MSTSDQAPETYTYPRTATLATRTLLTTDPAPPTITTSTDAPRPGLERKPTNHYAEAVAAAAASQKALSDPDARDPGATAAAATAAQDAPPRPDFSRQQSWKMTDRKREGMERMLSSAGYETVGSNEHGYSSRGAGA